MIDGLSYIMILDIKYYENPHNITHIPIKRIFKKLKKITIVNNY